MAEFIPAISITMAASHRLLKFEHEIVDRHVALEAREIVRVVGVAPEIARADQLEAGGFDFLAQGAFLDPMQRMADGDAPWPGSAEWSAMMR